MVRFGWQCSVYQGVKNSAAIYNLIRVPNGMVRWQMAD